MFQTNFPTNLLNQRIHDFQSLEMLAESYLTSRKAEGIENHTIRSYGFKIKTFLTYCNSQAITEITEITPDFIRHFILFIKENHNQGGVRDIFTIVRALFNYVESEELIDGWKNPVHKVKPPKVDLPPLEPISIEDFKKLIDVSDCRDKAIFMTLLDTGCRAAELLSINLEDISMDGSILIRCGKGHKSRTVFISKKTRRAVRAFLRTRTDSCPALFVSQKGEKIGYDGLRMILRRKCRETGVNTTLHCFRRAFCLNMLRNGCDVYSLKRLMGHSDLNIMVRYLALDNSDSRLAHEKSSPINNLSF